MFCFILMWVPITSGVVSIISIRLSVCLYVTRIFISTFSTKRMIECSINLQTVIIIETMTLSSSKDQDQDTSSFWWDLNTCTVEL